MKIIGKTVNTKIPVTGRARSVLSKFESKSDLKSSPFVGSVLPFFKISCSLRFTLTLILQIAIKAITANIVRRPNNKIKKLLSP